MPEESSSPKRISMEEIAQALGISKTTVSRALSGKGRIGAATKARIHEYLAKSDAVPTVRSPISATAITHNLALVIPDHFVKLDLPFLRQCMGGICNMTGQRGYDLLLCFTSASNTAQLERQLAHHKMDGVLLTRAMADDPCVELLRQYQVPFVLIGRSEDPTVLQADNDQTGAARDMTRLLLRLGARRIALLAGSTSYVVNIDRMRGHLQALAEFGITPEQSLLHTGIESDAQRTDALEAALEQRPDCLLCGDDRLTLDILQSLQARHIHVPGDLRVASLYDSELLTGLTPGVTAVQFDAQRLGTTACRMLLDRLAGKEIQHRQVEGYQVILRGSTE